MIHAYEDEDNVPMCEDLPLPYPIRTWDEMMEVWYGKRMDGRKAERAEGKDDHGAD